MLKAQSDIFLGKVEKCRTNPTKNIGNGTRLFAFSKPLLPIHQLESLRAVPVSI